MTPIPGFDDDAPVGERLQKFLSAAGVASRRHAEVMIKQGRVRVNDQPAHVGMRVTLEDVVLVDGVAVGPQAPRYVLLNKPAGVITTADDPQGRPTVVELVESEVRLYPVGRLDLDTSGLLLLTNDGDLAHRLMHPSFGVDKTYRVMVSGKLSNPTLHVLRDGVELEDGITSPAELRVLQTVRDRSIVELTIHEGRNRQVRRMFEAVGHPVVELVRTGYGPLTLGDVKPGASRDLTSAEVRKLNKAAGRAPARTKRAEPGSSAPDGASLSEAGE